MRSDSLQSISPIDTDNLTFLTAESPPHIITIDQSTQLDEPLDPLAILKKEKEKSARFLISLLRPIAMLYGLTFFIYAVCRRTASPIVMGGKLDLSQSNKLSSKTVNIVTPLLSMLFLPVAAGSSAKAGNYIAKIITDIRYRFKALPLEERSIAQMVGFLHGACMWIVLCVLGFEYNRKFSFSISGGNIEFNNLSGLSIITMIANTFLAGGMAANVTFETMEAFRDMAVRGKGVFKCLQSRCCKKEEEENRDDPSFFSPV